ncbi:hypothetical protein BCV70DRAFT_201376 [Testicularia cyperi]|uniref:BZIP domain-containing protein n=1 Tax=Testicularia cyperi TaxID=1882483 RepID=A0A317XMU5_9BASI|nr:hypothetical protein BCV70DRAFT_201376 [Testicularia cyperi]
MSSTSLLKIESPPAMSSPRANKRKPSIESSSDGGMADSEIGSPSKKITSSGKVSASQQLVPVPGNPDAPLVTKRTLQNRKAQREFRKRREARVRELEERCRRFDQIGLEANAELQRLARRLKDENEALKSLVARLGFAHMIPPIIESLGAADAAAMPPPPLPSYPPLDLSVASWARGPDAPVMHAAPPASHPRTSVAPAPAPTAKPSASSGNKPSRSASVSTSGPLSSLSHLPAFAGLLPVSAAGVNPSLLSESTDGRRNGAAASSIPGLRVPVNDGAESAAAANTTAKAKPDNDNSTFDNDWFAQLAQSGHDKDEFEDESNAAAQSNNQPASSVNPILSLNFAPSNTKSHGKNDGKSQANHGLTGSAMLGAGQRDFGLGLPNSFGFPGSSAPGNSIFPMPMPTQQNGALLNPNPIPFAFNLSDPSKPPTEQSWWSQMSNNQIDGDDSILDEKAQAVAQATGASNNGGAPSPFDLSAFLNGGLTPGGGGFSFGPVGGSDAMGNTDRQDSASQKRKSSDDGKSPENSKQKPLTQVEHATMFLRLLEAKMAQRSTSPYAQLGFQPPMHQQHFYAGQGEGSSDSSSSQMRTDDSALSPINVYSRLAQHPAFLSTNASELEELVDSIGSAQQPQLTQSPSHKRRSPKGVTIYPPVSSGLTPNLYGTPSASPNSSRSSSSAGSKDIEVDEKAVSKMLGLLDRKAPRAAAAAGF